MPEDFLKKIIKHKRQLLNEKQAVLDVIKDKLSRVSYTRYQLFKKMISRPGRINLIAEIKKASPSAGLIREEFDLLEIARIYVENDAAAISILTEDKYFLGKPLYVKKVSENFQVPILTKDFIIDENQVYEARFHGASAVLLILAILTDREARHLMGVSTSLDLDCLVEVHDLKELERALKLNAEIIGINNRDLNSLNVDMTTCAKLIPRIPKNKVIVAESGIKTHQDIKVLKKLGVNAVLIGETFMRENDIGQKIREVMHGHAS